MGFEKISFKGVVNARSDSFVEDFRMFLHKVIIRIIYFCSNWKLSFFELPIMFNYMFFYINNVRKTCFHLQFAILISSLHIVQAVVGGSSALCRKTLAVLIFSFKLQ